MNCLRCQDAYIIQVQLGYCVERRFLFFHSPRHHFSYARLISDNRLSGSEYIASKSLFNIQLRKTVVSFIFVASEICIITESVLCKRFLCCNFGHRTIVSTSYLSVIQFTQQQSLLPALTWCGQRVCFPTCIAIPIDIYENRLR